MKLNAQLQNLIIGVVWYQQDSKIIGVGLALFAIYRYQILIVDQRWKNVQILQIYLCYFFWAVLIFWLYTRKQTKTLCYYHCAKSNMLKLLCYQDCAISTVQLALCNYHCAKSNMLSAVYHKHCAIRTVLWHCAESTVLLALC